MTKNRKSLLRLAFSLALLAYLLHTYVDLDKLPQVLGDVEPVFLLLTLLANLLGIIFSVLRWSWVLGHLGARVSFFRLLRLYFVGYFFNAILPGMISGDVVRAYKVAKSAGVEEASSVLIERILGLIALLAIAVPATIIHRDLLGDLAIGVQAVSLLILISFLLLLSSSGKRRLRKLALVVFRKESMIKRLNTLFVALRRMREGRMFVGGFVLSLLFLVCSFCAGYFLMLSLGAHIPLLYIVAVMSITRIVTMIPISFSGIGVKEFIYIKLYFPAGLTIEQCVMLSLLGYFFRLFFALVGAILNLFGD